MKPTIVYIHGLNSTARIFNHLHNRLPDHNAIFINYDSTQRVEKSYNFIVNNIPKSTPIIIISHSLGGILGLLIANRDNNIHVDKLITMSAPFGGSSIAALLKWIYPHYDILKDIAPTSNIIREVNNSYASCKFLSLITNKNPTPYIHGPNDGVVTVKSQMACNPNNRILIDSNHFEIVQDDNAFNSIKNFIF